LTFTVVIPARLASTRLPGKVLADLGGRPVLAHVHARALASGAARVVIATDDGDVARAAEGVGAEVVMTSPLHESGTDRLAEAAVTLGLGPETVVVNVQGDEPEMPPEAIAAVAAAVEAAPTVDIATVALPIEDAAAFADPNIVKVVADEAGDALYFSRAPIPWPRDLGVAPADLGGAGTLPHAGARRHVGLYAYRAHALARFTALPPHPLELAERLEQLRALAHGMTIRVIDAPGPIPPGIDTAADLDAARARLVAV